MSASDCYQLGYEAFLKDKLFASSLWLEESLYHSETLTNTLKLEILNKLLEVYQKLYKYSFMLKTMQRILKIKPNDIVVMSKMAMLEKNAIETHPCVTDVLAERDQEIEEKIVRGEYDEASNDEEFEIKLHYALCRGDVTPTSKELAPLRCRYLTHTSAFLKIAPLKFEEVSLDPYIIVFHEVMYDKEIELIKLNSKYKVRV